MQVIAATNEEPAYHTGDKDTLLALGDMTRAGPGNGREASRAVLEGWLLGRGLALGRRRGCDRTDPASVAGPMSAGLRIIFFLPRNRMRSRVDDAASDRGALLEAEIRGSLLAQTLADRLSGREDQAVLARDAAELLKVVLDHIAETCIKKGWGQCHPLGR